MERIPTPAWMEGLDNEDLAFIRNFLLASGSLKEIAALYNVSYPTIRLRLDRLIQKIKMGEDGFADQYATLVKKLAVDGKIDLETARLLISEHKRLSGEGEKHG